jgi:hypothetical protein
VATFAASCAMWASASRVNALAGVLLTASFTLLLMGGWLLDRRA